MNTEISKIIGENIKKFRESKGLSRNELSDKIDVSASGLANYENGNRLPSVEVLIRLATVLQIPIDLLIGSKLTPYCDLNGNFSYMVDSQFGEFNPEYESYMEFLERNLSLLDDYKKDNVFVSNSLPSFTSELITCICKSYLKNGIQIDKNDFNKFLDEKTNIHNILLINDEKELPLSELMKLLDFYRQYDYSDFCNFINYSSFGLSDKDVDIQNIIKELKYSINNKVKIPGGFTSKPELVSIGLAYQSLVNLIYYIGKEDVLPYIDDESYKNLLIKNCDLLEFELFKLKKEANNHQ